MSETRAHDPAGDLRSDATRDPFPRERDEPPPLGSWPRMYALVLANLAFWIAVAYLLTRAFS